MPLHRLPGMPPFLFTRTAPSRALTALTAGLLIACAPDPNAGEHATAADVEAALARPEPLARAEALAAAYQRLPEGALPDVVAAYEEGFFDLAATELVLLAEWWAGFDPNGALQWAQRDWRSDQPEVLESVIRAWARQDPEAALRWLESTR